MRHQLRNTGLISAILLLSAIAPFSANAQTAATAPAAVTQATPAVAPVAASDQQATDADVESPYQLNLLYTGEEWENAVGGIHNGTMYMNNIDAQLRVDTDKAFGWTGGRFLVEGYYTGQNSLGNQYVGALDQQSPIDSAGYEMFRLYQAYYDQQFGNTDVLFGIYDLESEFSVTKPMSLFLSKNLTWNTALDQSGTMPQNGVVGPGNYPYTPLALRVRQTINDQWSVQAVLANGVADDPQNQSLNGIYFSDKFGAMGIGEVDYTPSKYTKVMVGYWGMTSSLPANNQTNADGSQHYVWGEDGGYIGGTTRLYSGEGKRGLDGFLTLGFSSPTSTNVEQSLNGGLVYTGLFEARPHDKIGFSFNENAAPASYRKMQSAAGSPINTYETSFEATYRAQINSWLTVQPDIQYIVDPAYDPTIKNDLVFGVHFEIGHLFNL